MSENLDLVRSIFAAWERGDWSSFEWAHPEIEYAIADGPEPGSWRGMAETAEGVRSFLDPWEEPRLEVDECRELDEGRVLAFARIRAHAKTSGLEIGDLGGRGTVLLQIRDGKVVRLVLYWDRDRALADLGLVE